MCDMSRVSGWLIGGKVAALAMLATLGIGIANSLSLYSFAANVGLMALAIVTAGVAAACFGAAMAELDSCTDCADQLRDLRRELAILIGIMAAFSVGLIGIAIVAAVWIAGAVAIGLVLATFLGVLLAALAAVELAFSFTVSAFNDCRRRAMLAELFGFVTTLALVVVFVVFLVMIQVGISVLPLLIPGPG